MRCFIDIIPVLYKQSLVLGALLFAGVLSLQAEGIQQLAPTEADGPIMLETGRDDFGDFAEYDGPENTRLYITVGSPNEIVYLGLSLAANDDGQIISSFSTSQYSFRIRRATDGAIVHGPFIVNQNTDNVSSWADAAYGNYDVSEEVGGELMYQFEPDQAGEYYIEFNESIFYTGDRKVNIPYWDITVTDNGVPINGRVWSKNWSLRAPKVDGTQLPDCVWDREFKGTFYSYTSDGFVSKIDFSQAGMQGLSFNVAFNSTGPGVSGDLGLDRMSIPNENATVSSSEHQIFLSEPDPNIFLSGICGSISSAESFSCLADNQYCIDVEVTKPGQVELIIDFNQNGVLDDNSQDVSIIYEFEEGMLSACIPWDGLRGDGTVAESMDTVDLIFNYAQGVQHWSAYDVEFMRNGFCVETIRPICAESMMNNQLYWDDRNIPEDPGTGAVKDGRNGCACESGCRSWDNFLLNSTSCNNFNDDDTEGYGDKTTLNTWWFATTIMLTQANVPIVTVNIEGDDSVCDNESVTLTATTEGVSGAVSYSWTGPNGFMAATTSVTVSEGGEYCVTIMDDNGCSATDCKTITVIDSGIGEISYPDAISLCVGNSIDLAPVGDVTNYSFLWSPVSGGILDPTLPNQTIEFTQGITYSVQITNNTNLCSFTEDIVLTAFDDPVADFSTLTGCAQGLEVHFMNESVGGATYQWEFGDPTTDTDVSTEESPSYTYPSAGDYLVKLTVTSADGCQVMIARTVTVSLVSLTAGFDLSYTECDTDSVLVQFQNTSVNDAATALSYQWTFNVAPFTSMEENPSFTLYATQTLEATLTITTQDDCVDTHTENLEIILGAPTDQFPASIVYCDEPVQLDAAGDAAYTYTWSPSTGIDDIHSAQPTFSPTQTTTYTVTVTASGADDCNIVETLEVIVPEDIGLEVTGGGDVYCTPTATLMATTSSNSATIEWQNEAGEVVGMGTSLTVDVSGPANYVVIARDTFGCSETIADDRVSVNGGPVNVDVPDTLAVCIGEELIIMPTNLDANDTLSYVWSPAEVFVAGTETTATPDYIETVGPQDVSVTITNQFGCELTEELHLAVIDTNINLAFTSLLDCTGGTVSFTNTSTDAFGYVWNFGDASPLNYEEHPTHTYAAGGTYTVTLDIIYDVNCLDADGVSQEITVETPEIIADFEYDIVECSADSAIIQFFDTSVNQLGNTSAYMWTFSNGTPAQSSEQNPVLVVPNGGSVEVSFTIFTENDCDDTVTETLDVQLVDLDISLSDTLVVCPGGSVVLNSDGNDDLVHVWTPSETLDDASITSPVATPTETTTYFATAYSLMGSDTCFVTDSVVVFVPQDINLELDQEPLVETCGEDVVITATADVDVDIEWISTVEGPLSETGSVITVNPFTIDTIIAIATDQYGCMATDTVIVDDMGVDINADPSNNLTICDDVEATLSVNNLDPDDELTYQWMPTEYIVGPTDESSAVVRINELGEFVISVVVENQHACVDTLEIMVTVEEFAGLPLDTLLACANEPIALNPGGDPTYEYEWSPADEHIDLSNPANPVVTTDMPLTYYVTITDPQFGCSAMDSIFIDVAPQMNLEVTPATTVLCTQEELTFTANTDITPTSVTWYSLPANEVLGQGTTLTYTPDLGVQSIYAEAISADNCTERDTVEISIVPVNASITDTLVICEIVETVDLSVINNDTSQDINVVWNLDPPVTGPNVTVDVVEGVNQFSAIVTNQYGCVDTLNTTATIIDLDANITLTATPDSILLDESTTLTVEGCVGCTYEWVPDVGEGAEVTVTPVDTGYQVYTVYANLLGCEAEAEVGVFVLNPICDVDHVFFPNAFTPNGDGENDVLRLRSSFLDELLEFELLIYDRWGEEVYHSFDAHGAWDGTFRGEELAPDVYGYYLRVLCPMGEELIQKGNVTILR